MKDLEAKLNSLEKMVKEKDKYIALVDNQAFYIKPTHQEKQAALSESAFSCRRYNFVRD